jgi:hypothetical protein
MAIGQCRKKGLAHFVYRDKKLFVDIVYTRAQTMHEDLVRNNDSGWCCVAKKAEKFKES